jgi:hypothetical protein
VDAAVFLAHDAKRFVAKKINAFPRAATQNRQNMLIKAVSNSLSGIIGAYVAPCVGIGGKHVIWGLALDAVEAGNFCVADAGAAK